MTSLLHRPSVVATTCLTVLFGIRFTLVTHFPHSLVATVVRTSGVGCVLFYIFWSSSRNSDLTTDQKARPSLKRGTKYRRLLLTVMLMPTPRPLLWWPLLRISPLSCISLWCALRSQPCAVCFAVPPTCSAVTSRFPLTRVLLAAKHCQERTMSERYIFGVDNRYRPGPTGV